MDMLDNKEFENKAWESMNVLLDEEMPERKIGWWKLIGVIIPLLIGLFVVYFKSYKNDTNINHVAENVLIENVNNDPLEAKNIVKSSENNDPIYDKNSTIAKSDKSQNDKYNVNHRNSLVNSDAFIQANSSEYIKSNKNVANTTITEPIGIFKKKNKYKENTKSFKKQEYKLDQFNDSKISTLDLALLNNESPFIEASKIAKLSNIGSRIVQLKGGIEYLYFTNRFTGTLQYNLNSVIGSNLSPLSFETGVNFKRISTNTYSGQAFEYLKAEQHDATNIVSGSQGEMNVPIISSLDYLGVPMTFHYRMNRFNIGLGIENNFIINKNQANDTKDRELNENYTFVDQNVEFNTYQLNLIQGIDYNINPKWMLGVNFRFDLTGVEKNNTESDNKLNSIALSLSYKIK